MKDSELLRDRIVFVANGFVGEKELPRNGGFRSKWVTDIMLVCGFVKGYSWCMIAVEAVFRLSLSWLRKTKAKPYTELWEEVTRLINPSTQRTYNNFAKAKHFTVLPVAKATYRQLRPGDIVIFVKPKNAAFGHAGIVTGVNEHSFDTVEGNTNASGSANGDGWYRKHRIIEKDGIGLDIRGFLQLKDF